MYLETHFPAFSTCFLESPTRFGYFRDQFLNPQVTVYALTWPKMASNGWRRLYKLETWGLYNDFLSQLSFLFILWHKDRIPPFSLWHKDSIFLIWGQETGLCAFLTHFKGSLIRFRHFWDQFLDLQSTIYALICSKKTGDSRWRLEMAGNLSVNKSDNTDFSVLKKKE